MFDVRNVTAPSNILKLFQDVSNVQSYKERSSACNNVSTQSSSLSIQANLFYRIGFKVCNRIPLEIMKNFIQEKINQTLFSILYSLDCYIYLPKMINEVKACNVPWEKNFIFVDSFSPFFSLGL